MKKEIPQPQDLSASSTLRLRFLKTGVLLAAAPLLMLASANAGTSTDINTALATDDVTISGATSQTLAASETINSLTVSVSGGYGSGLNLGGKTLAITSGSLAITPDWGAVQGGTLDFGSVTANIVASGRDLLGVNGNGVNIKGSGGVTYTGSIFLIGVTAQYTGATTVNGQFYFNSGVGFSNRIADSSALVVNAAGSLNDSQVSAYTETVGSLAGSGKLNLSSVTLAAGGDNTSTTFSGAINNVSNVTKQGTGTLTLSGTGNSTGTLTASAGKLNVTGTFGSSAAVVTTGGTLEGNGTLGAVTVQSGGTLNVGVSETAAQGKLTVSGSLTLAGTTTFEIAGTSRGVVGGYDAVDVGASQVLTYGGTLTLSALDAIANGTYDLFSFTAGSNTGDFTTVSFSAGSFYTGTFTENAGIWTAISQGQSFAFDQATGDVLVTAVPEPSTWAMVAGGIGMLVSMQRMRRRQM